MGLRLHKERRGAVKTEFDIGLPAQRVMTVPVSPQKVLSKLIQAGDEIRSY
ncbi:hypothetical protein MYCOZU2_01967 [Mycobacterium intracellulare subsp. chimaera]|uniref:Uncharacterized protein n=1 Tax=Mycobacterium intracellulare subsp. chimaera TaxID=222805 RepID=A0A7U5MIV0_MYCIT|nr:hypothetical protein MYCOZU2_01967 [Mycobacterium intracellulare subsp. chimaera]